MIRERNIALAIILTIITCGIYGIYWMYCITNEVSLLSDDQSFSGGKAILFTIITCGIYIFFWDYQLGQNIARAQQNRGFYPKDNGVLFIVLSIFGLGIINYAIAQSEINKLIAPY
nr:DUF4234 domain-containing protein [Lysinibacillus timonensis]